jgi:predicted phosphate transport protein (TIGR00153 family)
LGLKIIPKDEKFFDLFEQQADYAVQGAKLLVELMKDPSDLEQKALLISQVEHESDEVAHEIAEKLNKTFITPMEREDIHALASALDDIIDFIDATVERMVLYKVGQPTEDAVHLANIILRAAEEMHGATKDLANFRNPAPIKKRWIEIHRLENEGDTASRVAIARLFENEQNPIEIIKWKEIYEHLEEAIDKCEDAANIVESVVLKNT